MPVELQRTLFIGLGGAGIKTILKTKSMFLERFGEVPPCVGFLGIDTDVQEFVMSEHEYGVSLDVHEAVAISVDHAYKLYCVHRDAFSWMPPQNVAQLHYLSQIGAGSVRTNGRFVFENNYSRIAAAVRDAYDRIMAPIIDTDKWELFHVPVQVHVAFSLSGGTGSGIFINMGYLLRDILGEFTRLHAYAIGPGVFQNCGDNVMANAYAAMLDMDYIMTYVDSDHPLELQTMDGTKSDVCKPYDMFYLVDNTNHCLLLDSPRYVYTSLGSSLFYRCLNLQNNILADIDTFRCYLREGICDIGDKRGWVWGQGMCEIMIDHEKLSRLFSARAGMELIRSIIGEDCKLEMEQAALKWIYQNNLCEHDADQVLDSLYDFSQMPQSVILSRRRGDARIESDSWILQGEQAASVLIDANFSQRIESVKRAISDKLSEIGTSENGLNGAKAFVETLMRAFDVYASEMEEELHCLEMKQDRCVAEIEELMCRWPIFNLAGRYQLVIQDAQYEILRIKVDILRHKKAAQFFAVMNGFLVEMSGSINGAVDMFKDVERELWVQRGKAEYLRHESSQFQIDLSDQVQIDGNHQDNTVERFIASLDGVNILDLSSLQTTEVMERILAFTSSLEGADFSSVSVEDIVLRMNDEEKSSLFWKAIIIAGSLLEVQSHGYPLRYQREWCYLTVPGGYAGSLASDVAVQRVIQYELGFTYPCYVPAFSSNSIIIYRHKAAYPVFQLESIVGQKRDFDRMSEHMSLSFDMAVEQKIMDENFGFSPNQKWDYEVLEMWVKGLIHGFIKKDGQKYLVQSKALSKDDKTNDYWFKLRSPEEGMVTEARFYAFEDFKSKKRDLKRKGDLLERIRTKEREMAKAQVTQLYREIQDCTAEEYVSKYSSANIEHKTIQTSLAYQKTKQVMDEEHTYRKEMLVSSIENI